MESSEVGSPARAQLQRELSRQAGGYKWLKRLGVLAVLAAIVAGIVVYRVRTAPPPPARYLLAELSQGDLSETVQSTGQVKPVTEVQVGAQVSGRVTKVFVDFNSQVTAGQVLAEIDPSLLTTQIESTTAQLAGSSASVARAKANLEAARVRLDRAKKLVAEKVGSQLELDSAQGAYDIAIAEVNASKAQVSQIGAQLKASKTNLEFSKILSPIEGVVITRSIDPGQTVQASFQAPVLFVLAQDLRKMRVFADIDEADVGRVSEDMRAEITVDAFPSVTFSGKVIQLRLSPVTTQGVVTYAAVLDVANDELKLRPGMTATVTITSASVKAVTRIPNSALRFRPAPPLDDKGKPIPQDPLPKLEAGKGRVWVVTDSTVGKEKVEPRVVDIGISDGIYTELLTDLSGEKIVRDETDVGDGKQRKGGF